ncbi:MAG: hypothetical protein ABSC19_16885 [Syntrophorhabdales bacterium]|jgi:hypothetical protein
MDADIPIVSPSLMLSLFLSEVKQKNAGDLLSQETDRAIAVHLTGGLTGPLSVRKREAMIVGKKAAVVPKEGGITEFRKAWLRHPPAKSE